jgi:hypothetical protein
MRSLPELQVFSRTDLRALGWSDPAITRAIGNGRILRLRRDQFTAGPADARVRAFAAVRGCSGAAIADRSATLVHGLPLVGALPPVPEVTVPPTGTGDLQGAHLYRATMIPDDVVLVDGHPVLSVPRTLIDLGRHRPMATMVAAADYALHENLTTLAELHAVLDRCRLWPGAARAARALRRVDGRAESPLESVSRLVLAWVGLPPPRPQQRIRNERGVIIARTDFYWDEFGVVGEADGKAKLHLAEDDEQAAARIDGAWDRHSDLEDLGLVVVRWGWHHAVRTPRQLEARVRRGFARADRLAELGLPRRWSLAPDLNEHLAGNASGLPRWWSARTA